MVVVFGHDVFDQAPDGGRLGGVGPEFPVEMPEVDRAVAHHDLPRDVLAVSYGVRGQVREIAVGESLAAVVGGGVQHAQGGGPVVAELLYAAHPLGEDDVGGDVAVKISGRVFCENGGHGRGEHRELAQDGVSQGDVCGWAPSKDRLCQPAKEQDGEKEAGEGWQTHSQCSGKSPFGFAQYRPRTILYATNTGQVSMA